LRKTLAELSKLMISLMNSNWIQVSDHICLSFSLTFSLTFLSAFSLMICCKSTAMWMLSVQCCSVTLSNSIHYASMMSQLMMTIWDWQFNKESSTTKRLMRLNSTIVILCFESSWSSFISLNIILNSCEFWIWDFEVTWESFLIWIKKD
jgi:hypothetical protein